MSVPTPDRVQLARDGFAGPLNCAQAVAAAFRDLSGLTPEQVEDHKRNGGGRAPDGTCGALFAGLELLNDGPRLDAVAAQFANHTGSAKCREIRAAKLVSCAGCVDTAATLLSIALAS